MPSFRGSSRPRDQTQVSYMACTGRRVLDHQCHPGGVRVSVLISQFTAPQPCTGVRSLCWRLYPCPADGSCFLRHDTEEAVLPPAGLLLGKEHHDHASTPVLPTPSATTLSPPAPGTSASSAHAKTGSKDSSTQTDKSAELFWPGVASLPTRSRLSGTPSNSPVLKHPAAKGAAEKLGTRSPPAL